MSRPVLIVFGVLAGIAAAAAETPAAPRVSITRGECQRLIRQLATPGAAYRPGVDVHGKPVAAADMPGSGGAIKVLPDVIEFNYSVNPVGYGQAKAAAAQSAALAAKSAAIGNQQSANSAGQAANTAAVKAAYQQKATLNQTLTALQAKTAGLTSAKSDAAAALAAVASYNHGDPRYQSALAAYNKAAGNLDANASAIAGANSAITNQNAIINANAAQVASLTATGTKLSAKLGDSATVGTDLYKLAQAQAALTALKGAGTNPGSPAYQKAVADVAAAQGTVDTTRAAIAANTTAEAQAQAQVDAGDTTASRLAAEANTLQSQQQAVAASQASLAASQSAQAATGPAGGNTQMPVAAIRYDVAKNSLTINGQPVGQSEKEAVALRCKQAGFQ